MNTDTVNTVKIEAGCEYRALKECLEKNNWKKDKCEKEWLEFQTLCDTNRKYVYKTIIMYNVHVHV